MGIIGGALKSGIAMKAARIAKREASKPQNQAKAKSLLAKVTGKSTGKSGSKATGRSAGKPTGRGAGKVTGRKR